LGKNSLKEGKFPQSLPKDPLRKISPKNSWGKEGPLKGTLFLNLQGKKGTLETQCV